MDAATQNLLIQLAYNALLARQIQDAETMYRVLVDIDSNNFYACLGLCYCLLQGPNWKDAQAFLAQLSQLAKSQAHHTAISRLTQRWQVLDAASPVLQKSDQAISA